jgi:hypothetical protein
MDAPQPLPVESVFILQEESSNRKDRKRRRTDAFSWLTPSCVLCGYSGILSASHEAAAGFVNFSVIRSDSPIASYFVRSKLGSCASGPSP